MIPHASQVYVFHSKDSSIKPSTLPLSTNAFYIHMHKADSNGNRIKRSVTVQDEEVHV